MNCQEFEKVVPDLEINIMINLLPGFGNTFVGDGRGSQDLWYPILLIEQEVYRMLKLVFGLVGTFHIVAIGLGDNDQIGHFHYAFLDSL